MSFRIVNGSVRLLATRTLNEVHPMEGAEHSPAEDAAHTDPPVGPVQDGSASSHAVEEPVTLDVLASRIDGMGKWAQATQQQIRHLLQQTTANDQLHSHLLDLRQAQDILASRLAEIDLAAADPADPVLDPVIGYHPQPEQQAQLFCALAEWQSTAPSLEKGRVAEMATRNGGTATYRYVDIADVSEVARSAGAAGLGHFHRELSMNGRSFIRTYLVHKGGGWICCDVPLAIRENSLTSAIQQWGAASTYARRYGLFLILGIAAGDEDDDGTGLRSSSQAPAPRRVAEGSSRPGRPVNTPPARHSP